MTWERKPILCLDFDGVLHSYTSGWKGAYDIPDPPVDGAKAFLEEAQQHFLVAIHSSRSHHPRGVDAMVDWCTEHFGEEITRRIHFASSKPQAMVTLDDRGWQFTGEWPAVADLLAFKPWNK